MGGKGNKGKELEGKGKERGQKRGIGREGTGKEIKERGV